MTPVHIAPIAGIPHVSSADDVHDGYFIPKGAIVFQNLWFVICCLIFLAHGPGFAIGVRLMSHDPEVYKNPMEFAPMRFLGPNPEQDVREYCFGFGRRLASFPPVFMLQSWWVVVLFRVCPGRHLADASVWIACVRILAVFDIKAPVGVDGRLQMPDVRAAPGIVTHPVEFECEITPHSAKAVMLISTSWSKDADSIVIVRSQGIHTVCNP
jgi:hypothetical protein